MTPPMDMRTMDRLGVKALSGIVGREEELAILRWAIDEAHRGRGGTVMIEGEAGVGKSRLVSEVRAYAEDKGVRMLVGRGVEGASPFMPFMNALKDVGSEIITEGELSVIEEVFLLNEKGMLIAHAARTLRPEVDEMTVGRVFGTIRDFMSRSFEGRVEGGNLDELQYGTYKILFDSAPPIHLAVVVSGGGSKDLKDSMKALVLALERDYSKALSNWRTGMPVPRRLETDLAMFASLEFRAERRLDAIDPKREQDRMFDSILGTILTLSRSRPVVLVIDDMQWLDDSSLDLLHYISRNLRTARVVLIGCYRPEEGVDPESKHPQRLIETLGRMAREKLYTPVSLRRLKESETTRMVSNMFPRNDFPLSFHERIFKDTEGNPFFIEEIVEALVTDGSIAVDKDGAWHLKGGTDLALPSTIKDVVLRRMDRLEEGHRRLLETASVMGPEFNIDVLRTVVEADEETLLLSLDELARMKILKELPGGDAYAFDHGVIREVLYESMGRNVRRMVHKKVAETLERMYAKELDPVVYDLARHYGNTKDSERALFYSVRAARKAMRLFALKEARTYFDDALRHLAEAKDMSRFGGGSRVSVEVGLLNEAASASYHTGDFEQAQRHTTRVLELAQDEGLYHEMIRAYLLRGMITELKSEHDEAVLDFEAAKELGEKIGDQKGMLEAMQSLGKVYWGIGKHDKALEYLNDCIRGAEKIGEGPLLANALITKGNVYNVREDHEEAIKLYERGLRIAKEHNATYELMRGYNNLGDIYMDINDLDKAESYFNKCFAVAERSGDQRFVAYSMLNLGETFIKRGEFPKAKAHIARSLEVFQRLDEKSMVAAVYENFGIIHTHDKNWAEATVCFEIAINTLKNIKQPHSLAKALCSYATMLREKGDRLAAIAQLETSKSIYAEVGAQHQVKELDVELSAMRTGVEPTRVSIVGREDALGRLQYLFDIGTGTVGPDKITAPKGMDALKGTGAFVLLEGAQGLGKSRVMDEMVSYSRGKGVTTITGRCLRNEAQNPYYPFIQALSELFQGKDQTSLQKFMRRAPIEVLAAIPGLARGAAGAKAGQPVVRLDGEAALSGADLGAMKDRMFEVLSRLLLEFGEPLALMLEDMHHADLSSLQLLTYIAREIEGSKTYILASYSPDAVVAGNTFAETLLALDRSPASRSVRLEPLDRAQVKELIGRFLMMAEVPEAFAAKVHERTKGNPMFIEEILKALPRGAAPEEMTKYDLDKVHVPGSVLELIAGQLALLSPEERELLEYASVAGSSFRSRMLFETMGLGGEAEPAKEVKGVLEDLVQKRYLRFAEDGTYTFNHPMVQQVVYESLPPDRRKNLHKAFGRAWERAGKEDLERVAFDLAYHYGRGGSDDKAFRYLMLAGQRAEAMSAPREAEVFFRDALRMSDVQRSKRGEESTISAGEVLTARHQLDQALVAQGKLDEAKEVSRISLSLARDGNDATREAEALMDIGEIASIRSMWDEARSTFDRAKVLCLESGFKRGLFRANKGLAWIAWRRNEFDRAFQHANECIKIAKSLDDKHLLAQGYMELGAAHSEKGDYEDAIENISMAKAIFEAAGDKQALSRAHNNIGVSYREKGDPIEAISHFERSAAIARDIGAVRMMGYATTNLSECHILMGNLPKAYEICSKALSIFLKLDEPFMVSSCYRRLGMIERRRRNYEAAEAHLTKSIGIMRHLESPAHNAEAHYELGLLYIDAGELAKARTELETSLGIFQKVGMIPGQEKTLKVLADLVKLGKIMEAKPGAPPGDPKGQ